MTLSEVTILIRDLSRALKAHVDSEAERAGVPPKDSCPCHTDVLARAAEFLDDDEDPEPTMNHDAGAPGM